MDRLLHLRFTRDEKCGIKVFLMVAMTVLLLVPAEHQLWASYLVNVVWLWKA